MAQLTKPGTVVWKGDDRLPAAQQGLKILEIPVGQPEYVRKFLEEKAHEHHTLFQRIPVVEDPQAAWLLLLMCASTRANFWLRGSNQSEQHTLRRPMMHRCGNACARSSIPTKGNQRKSPPRCLSSREAGGSSAQPGLERQPIGPAGQTV